MDYITWKDYIWISCAILLNVVYFSRKVILAIHGYGISFIDFGKDFVRLREIVREASGTKKYIFAAINYLVPISLLVGITFCILARSGSWG